jgi:hypothetical protein
MPKSFISRLFARIRKNANENDKGCYPSTIQEEDEENNNETRLNVTTNMPRALYQWPQYDITQSTSLIDCTQTRIQQGWRRSRKHFGKYMCTRVFSTL